MNTKTFQLITFILFSIIIIVIVDSQVIYKKFNDFLTQSNQYDKHIGWILEKIEVLINSTHKNFVIEDNGCVDIVIYPIKLLNCNQKYFLKTFLKLICDNYNYPIRVRYPIPYDPNDVIQCRTHVVLHFNTSNDVIQDFEMWHNYKTSSVLYLIAPFSDESVNPEEWQHVFTHPFMKLIIGWRVYRLTNPFDVIPRSIKESAGNDDVINITDLIIENNFNGKLLNISTLPCTPAHNWLNDATVMNRTVPKAGDRELICSGYKRISNCSK